MMTVRPVLESFSVDTMPALDLVVRGALELFAAEQPEPLTIPFRNPLVLGSGNAAPTSQIVCAGTNATFADEATYIDALKTGTYDGVVLFSASGSKHAIAMAKAAKAADLPVLLVTNNPTAPAATGLDPTLVQVYPKNREPYTYNTSTYLGPILASTKEKAVPILEWIDKKVSFVSEFDFMPYDAITIIIPTEFALMGPMIQTKFDELFGPKLHGRVFTIETIKHAKTVVPSETELFVSFGIKNTVYGEKHQRLFVPLPPKAGYATAIAVAYSVVGYIQLQHPPYFKEAIVKYAKTAGKLFKQTILPIVE